MGMFAWVHGVSKPCWKCGHIMTEWQTKDIYDLSVTVNHPDLEKFYNSCSKCETWNQYKKVSPATIVVTEEAVFTHDIEGEKYWNRMIEDAKVKEE